MRAVTRTNGLQALEVALRSLTPARGRGPTVWLVGVTHLGTTNYYAELQRFLDAQSLVLFEGVGATNKHFQLQRDEGFNLQASLAKALGLAFQLQTIDYSRDHFRNSDLGVDALVRILSGETNAPAPAAGGPPEMGLNQLIDTMQGTGLLGALARFGVALLESSPRLQSATKVVMIEVLGSLSSELTQMPGLPAGFQRLLCVLIEERDKVVVCDVQNAARARPRPRSIAVFYGAGHMIDLEQRLRDALAYRPAEERWLTAFAIDPRQAGLTEFELNWMRRWIRGRLEELRTNP